MRVVGIRSAGSLGVARYCDRLAAALAARGTCYELRGRPGGGLPAHWHLANSSRAALWQAPARRAPFVITVHDVRPRAAALLRAYRVGAYPLVLRRAAVLVAHSRVAADMLVAEAGVPAGRIALVPHPATPFPRVDRAAARRTLGWEGAAPLAVLPGVVKPAKLVAQALEAAAPLLASGRWRLALAGRIADAALARRARALGAAVLADPDDEAYASAIAAADVVLVLRAGSVGESNGPLLDALGAGRAVLATDGGSIAEVAGGAALLCSGEVAAIRAGLERLADAGERGERERAARARAAELSWAASAAAHDELFREVFAV